MSYRQSSYDPLAPVAYGPALKPYNMVQWCGVALIALGVVGLLIWFGAVLGLVPAWGKDFFRFGLIGSFGSILINSRREEIPPEQQAAARARQRRRAVITLIIAAVAVAAGFTIVILSKGA